MIANALESMTRRVADFTEANGLCGLTRPQRACRCRCHASTFQECGHELLTQGDQTGTALADATVTPPLWCVGDRSSRQAFATPAANVTNHTSSTTNAVLRVARWIEKNFM